MMRKSLAISLMICFLFVFSGVKYIFAAVPCPQSCCCHAAGSNQSPAQGPERMLPQHACCCGTEDISACQKPQKPTASEEMAFSQNAEPKPLAQTFIFSSLSTGPYHREESFASTQSDHPLGQYFKIPLYLSNLSLII